MNQLELDLPESENEPKPWMLRVWRYHSHEDILYITKEEAVEDMYWRVRADMDEYVEGVFGPNGEFIQRVN